MTDDARSIRRFMFGWQYPLGDYREPRYTKLFADSAAFPLGMEMLDD